MPSLMLNRAAGQALGYLCLAALVFATGYLTGRGSLLDDYGELVGRVEQHREEAAARLRQLTAERDRQQALLDQQAMEQEKKDAHAQAEIARLAGELGSRPVRVRVVAGHCGGSAGGDPSAAAADRAADAGAADGVLPAENSRRLGAALTEVETLSAAYASCRASLVGRLVE